MMMMLMMVVMMMMMLMMMMLNTHFFLVQILSKLFIVKIHSKLFLLVQILAKVFPGSNTFQLNVFVSPNTFQVFFQFKYFPSFFQFKYFSSLLPVQIHFCFLLLSSSLLLIPTKHPALTSLSPRPNKNYLPGSSFFTRGKCCQNWLINE